MRKVWIYLSPHLDDVALSCGGLIWDQVQVGNTVMIWTVCAGDIPAGQLSPFAQNLHKRWETGDKAALVRRAEDILSCQILGAAYKHFNISDCIYRKGVHDEFLYQSEEELFGKLSGEELPLIDCLSKELQTGLPEDVNLVCPLAIGNHVDHQLVRAAAEMVGIRLYYYADYPYVLEISPSQDILSKSEWERLVYSLSYDGLEAWYQAVAAHRSQISSFWRNEEDMRMAIGQYVRDWDGVTLWRPAK